MPRPFLSIIIPVLNEAASIRSHLEQLQTLRSQGTEVILVDGGSIDGTTEQAQALADKITESACGRALQMNVGASISAGEVLLFLHADTRLPKSAFENIYNAIATKGIWGRFDVRIDGTHPVLRVVERMMNWRSRVTGIATGDQAIFVRRDVFEQLGGYPEQPLMEDIALTTALKSIASPVCLREYVITSGRRWDKQGMFRTIFLMWRLRSAYFFGADPFKLAIRYGYTPRQR